MAELLDILPPPDTALRLEPEELAGFVMEYLHSLPPHELMSLNRNTVGGSIFPGYVGPQPYPNLDPRVRVQLAQAVMEAWFWLEREGFLAPKPGLNRDAFFITRRGQRVKHAVDLAAIRKGDLLPRRLLHPVIAEKVWSLFLRGEYETAVFQAFKEVEVAARNAGGFGPTDLGVELMRKAFNPRGGPLRDAARPEAEQEALAHLFAGAIGLYKNPTSHRNVNLGAEETIEILMVASHLLRIVDATTAKSDSYGPGALRKW